MNLQNKKTSVDQKKPIFLIFEPDERAALAAKTLLIGAGYKPIMISSETELITIPKWKGIKGIVLGDRLPGTNTQLVVEWLSSDPAAKLIPVMLLVKSSFAGSIQVKMPSPYWVIKPVSEKLFLDCLREIESR